MLLQETNTCYVYCVRNQITGKQYIGKTTYGRKRVVSHFRLWKTPANHKNPFYLDIKKYGKENFVWGVVEYAEEEKLKERETHYINLWETHIYGYNKLPQYWILEHPDSHTEVVYSLKEVCEKYSLSKPSLHSTLVGKRLQEKGFRLLPRNQKEKEVYGETRRKKEEGKRKNYEGKKGGDNFNSKLTQQQVLEIRNRYTGEKGEIVRLGEVYGVSPGCISRILHNSSWKHI